MPSHWRRGTAQPRDKEVGGGGRGGSWESGRIDGGAKKNWLVTLNEVKNLVLGMLRSFVPQDDKTLNPTLSESTCKKGALCLRSKVCSFRQGNIRRTQQLDRIPCYVDTGPSCPDTNAPAIPQAMDPTPQNL